MEVMESCCLTAPKVYMTQSDMLKRIASPVNLTTMGMAPSGAFRGAADQLRGAHVLSIAQLLDRGVQCMVHIIFRDRDWVCNWMDGGRISSLAARFLVSD
ncbi:hypothetical protein LEL_10710 [Akanthomyces lecanii RCEF 1005]|uniref:Uncharacterized protein n=1 Tax=Akanthomyces lecanii RCEF 1005 TaxID=1081108 RepID=A0A167V9I3_CORDF|nr:hypothetical protein LEL_10710 [Akanthomyces lecanii RCEF 1005]